MLNRLAVIAALALAAPAAAQDAPETIEQAQQAFAQALNSGGELRNWSFPPEAKKPEWSLARRITRAVTQERCITRLTLSRPTENNGYPRPVTTEVRFDWAQLTEVSSPEPVDDRVHFRTPSMARGESATIVFPDAEAVPAMAARFLFLANSCAAIRR